MQYGISIEERQVWFGEVAGSKLCQDLDRDPDQDPDQNPKGEKRGGRIFNLGSPCIEVLYKIPTTVFRPHFYP